jgi:hypothetical protein
MRIAELESELESLSDTNAELAAQLTEVDASGSSNSDEERVYLASRNRRHFHRPGCKWAAYIPDRLLIEFCSHREAVEADFKPCKTCRA